MPAPPRGVVTTSKLPHRRPAENLFDAATDAAGSLWLLFPDRFQHFHDMRRGNFLDRQIANVRQHVLLKRGLPLPSVLGVAPAIGVRLHAGRRALPERHGAGALGLLSTPVGSRLLPHRERIGAVEKLHAKAARPFPRVLERHVVPRAEAEIVTPAIEFVS